MLNTLFQGVFSTSNISTADIPGFLACIAVALLIGGFLAFVYRFKSRASKSFLMTLILLPSIVAVVILMVNGNIGAGIAVAGAFSLVRFRSVPGNAKDIASIFLAMGAGLICGMGYLGFAVLFTLILGIVMLILNSIDLGSSNANSLEKSLRIAIPEDLNYTDVFEEILAKYTRKHELISVKTANMGSIFKLNYNITLNDPAIEKELIDELRVRNGNLEISISRQEVNINEL
ncbi:MAG: DUF4956 domain-containing protein [Lachnospiraceae bacterium]